MDIKEKIMNWLVKDGAFTPEDKKEIKAAAQEAGIEVTFKSRCSNCYSDAVILLAKHYEVKASEPKESAGDGRYSFGAKGQVIWYENGRKNILSAKSDVATIERFIAANPNQKYFVKEKEED